MVPITASRVITDVCGGCFNGFFYKRCRCIQCDLCDHWYHSFCVGIKSYYQFKKVSKQDSKWTCPSCVSNSQDESNIEADQQFGIVTQTLSDLHLAQTQPITEPVSALSQVIRGYRNASCADPTLLIHLPSTEEPRHSLTDAKWEVFNKKI